MNDFNEKFDALIEKYTELLIGETSSEMKEKVTKYVLYSYIAKSMPPLAKHWNSLYPEGKEEMKKLVQEIKTLNEQRKDS
ncbi:hypothetical protein JOC86_002709 [Bacillus pakistanensis]|uniref:DUF2573 family protein n=1 Tax=Rossellomorea pakistanensis TaxID=992288 RepID=A0ABS2NE88_9BACI|nr:DUF2573 family protein [Bacillus pakistanensis]MBM7586167.1 hypothetical protein [Bacillus pakistanensis]